METNPGPMNSSHHEAERTVTCICCHSSAKRSSSVIFYDFKYDFNNPIVSQSLSQDNSSTLDDINYICQTCHRQLRIQSDSQPKTPKGAAAAQKRKKRSSCEQRSVDDNGIDSPNLEPRNKQLRLQMAGPEVQNVPDEEDVHDAGSHIDAAVHLSFDQSEEVEMNEEIEMVTCTCCHRMLQRPRCVAFRGNCYNFENEVVRQALSTKHRFCPDGGSEYMCYTCHNNLRQTEPKMPRLAVARSGRKGAEKFLKACEQKPEFVCTCCHRLLFKKTVKTFQDRNYDFTNETVVKTLAEKYRYKSQCHDAEYICFTCHNNLHKKKPKMPAQAVANGLSLPEIPEELKNLNDLERRLISLRIPFMKIMALHRAGSHFKVNGPCVNVPSTINKFCDLLPRLPDEAQFIPMKLKRKIVYKGYHMYGYIRKEVVMNAVKWLKENNEYYKDVQLNEMWDEQWMETELGDLLTNTQPDQADRQDLVAVQSNEENPDDPAAPTPDTSELEPLLDNPSQTSVTIAEALQEKQNEQELKEDQNAANRNAEVCGQPYSSTVQLENMEDAVYSIAPGEGNVPKYILLDKDAEVLGFPDLFPTGTGGYETSEKRETDLSLRKYYQQRLLNVDGRFGKNIEYIACAQYSTELKQLQSDAGIALRLTKGRKFRGQSLNAGMLKDAAVVRNLVFNEHAYKYMKNVRGSPAYWQHQLYDVLAMIRSLNIPTWFLTLSAADLHWPEIIQAIGLQYGHRFTKEEVRNMDWQTKSNYLMWNPVTACRMFQYRVESFFSEYILSDENPLGEVHDYVIKIEFQERGSPHAHCLLWVKDAPRVDVDSDDIVCEFIDNYISGRIPTDDEDLSKLVTNLETHSHSAYCRRNGSCRFGFPKAPSPRTVISRVPTDEVDVVQTIKQSQLILAKVYDALETDVNASMDELLQKANVTEEELVKSLKIARKGKNIILKRSPKDTFTNGCSHDILQLWQANIDFQYVLDAYSTVMYVVGYMMKSEKAMGELLKRVAKECRDDDISTQLKKLGAAFIGQRVVGMPESVMRQNSMWLIRKSRKVLFLNNNLKEDRVSLPKTGQDLDSLEDEDEDIFMTSIHDRYAARPDELNDKCLAYVALNYDVVERSTPAAPEDCSAGPLETEDCPTQQNRRPKHEVITLKDDLGKMRKRRREALMRTHSFNIAKDRERHFHGQLLLFYPWRSENNLKGGYDTYEEHYNAVKDVVIHNAQNHQQQVEDLEEAFVELAENGPPESNWDAVAPAVEEDNVAAREEGYFAIRNIEDEDLEDHNNMMLENGNGDPDTERTVSVLSMQYTKEAQKDIMSASEYRANMRKLNAGQRKIVMYNRAWCKEAVRKIRNGEKVTGYKIFLSGRGGTGKSHVINLIRRDVIYFLRFTDVEPDKPLVLLTAPTGSAAFQISGVTIYSGLQLNPRNGNQLSYEKKAILVNKLSQLKLLVTDEISMVGAPTLQHMNDRLCMIKNDSECGNDDFGGVSILAVGDLYQLPPVKQPAVHKPPKTVRELSDLAPLLWHQFKLHELTEVMRQKDKAFAEILNLVRVQVPDPNSKEEQVLRSRELTLSEDDPSYPKNAMHVYARNKYATMRNEKMLQDLPGTMYTSIAIDCKKDKHTNIADASFSDNPRKTGNLLKELHIKINARVMLTTNVDTTDGLTNGAMGTVTNLVFKNGTSQQIEAVLVKFDSPTAGVKAIAQSKYKDVSRSSVPIKRIEATFPVNEKKSFQGSRIQFPLFLCWAVSIHKCQGITVEEIVVDMTRTKGKYQKGQAYVALSRVTTLQKLHIINYCRDQIEVSPDVEAEMNRLRQNTIQDFPDPFTRLRDSNAFLSIAHLNVRNLLAKKDDIICDMDLCNADILCLSETHLDVNDEVLPATLGLSSDTQIFRCDRNQHGGGMIVCIKCQYDPKLVTLVKEGMEIVGVQISVPNPVLLFCTYRPPTYGVRNFLDKLCAVLNDCELPMCVLGDFNEDILGNADKPIQKTFYDAGFTQHVNRPTRDSGTLLDHVYTKNIHDVHIDVMDCYYSDHDTVYCSFKTA